MLRSVSLLATVATLVTVMEQGSVRAEPIWSTSTAGHFGISLGLSGGGYAGLSLLGHDPPALRFALATGLAFMPGLMKEIYDSGRPGNSFSGLDLAWDAVGVVTGALLALGIDLLLSRASRRSDTKLRAEPSS